jgi:hypothetical protein
MRNFEIIILSVTTIVLSLGIVFFINKEQNKCDTTVVLDDGTELRCKDTYTANGGLTNIKTCDDENISIPLNRIKIIKHDKDE